MADPAPLGDLLAAAARGTFPSVDGSVRVLPAPSERLAVLVGLSGVLVVAAEVAARYVHLQLTPGDFSAWLAPPFLGWLSERLGRSPATHDAVFVARGRGGPAPAAVRASDDVDHPRVRRASRYQEALRVFRTPDGRGLLVLGRGVAGRTELAFEVEPAARGAGLGRALARSALALVPSGEPVFAQVAPANAASLRAIIAAGFAPIGAEVLFPAVSPEGPP